MLNDAFLVVFAFASLTCGAERKPKTKMADRHVMGDNASGVLESDPWTPEPQNWTGYDWEHNLSTTPVGEILDGMPSSDVLQAVRIISICGNVLGGMAVVLNIGFLLGMRSLKDKSSAFHPFMWNLSLADSMASLTFLVTQLWPRGPFAYIEPFKEFILVQGLPYLFRSTPWMFFTGYLLTLSCLTVNQYVAVCRPLKYTELVSRRIVSISLLVVWAISSLQIVVPLIVLLVLWGQEDRHQAMLTLFKVSSIEIQVWMGVFAASTLFNICLNVMVYCKIRQLKIRRRQSYSRSSIETLGIRMKQEAFVTVSLLLAASIFCRLPFPLMGLVRFNLHKVISMEAAILIGAVVVLLLYINFFADPIIYIIRMKEVRHSYTQMLQSCASCCRRTSYGRNYAASLRLLTTRTVETTIGDLTRKPSDISRTPPPPHPRHREYVHVEVQLQTESTI